MQILHSLVICVKWCNSLCTDKEEEGNRGDLENNGITLLLSVSEEDDSAMLSQTCLQPSLVYN